MVRVSIILVQLSQIQLRSLFKITTLMFNEYVKKKENENVNVVLLYSIQNMIYCVQYVYHLISLCSSYHHRVEESNLRDRILMYDGTRSIQMKTNTFIKEISYCSIDVTNTKRRLLALKYLLKLIFQLGNIIGIKPCLKVTCHRIWCASQMLRS